MNEIMCRYAGNREQALVSYLYGELEPADRADFDAHLSTCARCRTELTAFTEVKAQLGRWATPEFAGVATVLERDRSAFDAAQDDSPVSAPPVVSHLPSSFSAASHRQLPVWARVAAAVLCIGIGAGLANLDVRYDSSGLHVRTGWLRDNPRAAADAPAVAAPTTADLAALEERLRSEISAVRATNTTASTGASLASTAAAPAAVNPEVLRRVRALIDESERRQQRELALRVGELIRDVNGQRQSDLARIDRSLGVIQTSTGVEMARQRETLNNILVRTSLQK